MHPNGSPEYQLVVASSREMMKDLLRLASPPPTDAMTALEHMRNL
jgi:hypothetical protein